MVSRVCEVLRNLCTERRGATAIITGLAATVLIGFTGLAIDVAAWEVAQHKMQGAADQAAYSAMIAGGGANGVTEAKAATASVGYVDGQNGVTVTVNQPPAATDPNSGNANAIQVIVSQPQPQYFTRLFLSSPPTVSASSVAAAQGGPCVIALDGTASKAVSASGGATNDMPNCDLEVKSNSADALDVSGGGTLTVNNSYVVGNCDNNSGSSCSSSGFTANGKNQTGVSTSKITDPFASFTAPTVGACPSGCPATSTGGCNNTYTPPSHTATTIYPGVYCGGINVNGGGAALTMSPGVYILANNGGFAVTGGSNDTLSSGSPPTCSGPDAYANGNGVTIYLAGSNSNGQISISSCVAFTAPTTGNTAGIVFWVDKNVSNSQQDGFTGGSLEYINGAIYDPSRQVKYTGSTVSGTDECTLIVADNIVFSGSSSFDNSCLGGSGTAQQVKLVE